MSFSRISIVVLCLAMLATPAFAGIRFGGISVGVGYAHYSGPGYYAYGYPYFYDPFWAPFPWYSPYYSVAVARPMGEIHLAGAEKLAEVYIDGGYAGIAKDLKTLHLDPGAYTVEIHAQGKPAQQRRVYVISNKIVKVDFSKEQR